MTTNPASKTSRSVAYAAGAIALAAIAWNAGSVTATLAQKFVPPPAVVGVVDLEAVLAGLQERVLHEAELKAKAQEQATRVNKMGDEAKAAKEQLDSAPEAAKPALREKFRDLNNRTEAEAQLAGQIILRMQADLIRDLYDKIDKAAEKLAKRDGYAIVLASDEGVEIPEGDFEKVMQRISLKRMLYVAKELDMTQDLITMMNNDFAIGKPAVGAAAPPAPTTPAKPTAAVPTPPK